MKIVTVADPVGGDTLSFKFGRFSGQTCPNTLSRLINYRRIDSLAANLRSSIVENCVKIIIAFHDVSPESALSLVLVLSWRDATQHPQPSVTCRAFSRSPDCRNLRNNAVQTFRPRSCRDRRRPGESAFSAHDLHARDRGFANGF